jgi:hypothetical protein
MRPLAVVGSAVVGYLPNLFFIVVIIAVNYYVTRLVRALFDEFEQGILMWGFFTVSGPCRRSRSTGF